jgi:hypothetical protein
MTEETIVGAEEKAPQTKIERYRAVSVDMLKKADGLRITNTQEYEVAAEIGRAIKDIRRKIVVYWDGTNEEPGPCKLAHRTWKSTISKRDEMLKPLDRGTVQVDRVITDYDKEQERVAFEKQREADLEERRRQDELTKARLEAAKERSAPREELRQIKQEAKMQPVRTAPIRTVKPDGVSVPKRWKGRVTNLKSLLAAVLQGKAPITLLKVDETALNQFAVVTKGTQPLAGVEFYPESQVRYGRTS